MTAHNASSGSRRPLSSAAVGGLGGTETPQAGHASHPPTAWRP